MKNRDNISLDKEPSSEGFNLFDLIFFAWKSKYKYSFIFILLFLSSFAFLHLQYKENYTLSMKISEPSYEKFQDFIDLEQEYFSQVRSKTSNDTVFSPAKFQKIFTQTFDDNYKLKRIFVDTLATFNVSKNNLDIEDIATDLSYNSSISKFRKEHPYEGLIVVDKFWLVNISYNNQEILDEISKEFVNNLEKEVTKEILNNYYRELIQLENTKKTTVRNLKREIEIIENYEGEEQIEFDKENKNNKVLLMTSKSFNPKVLSLEKTLEVNKWLDVDLEDFRNNLKDSNLHEFSQSLYTIQSKSISSKPRKTKRNAIITIMCAFAITLFVILLNVERYKRKI